MLENFMIFSVFLNVLCLLIVLGLLILAASYILLERIRDVRRNKIQKYLDEVITRSRELKGDEDE